MKMHMMRDIALSMLAAGCCHCPAPAPTLTPGLVIFSANTDPAPARSGFAFDEAHRRPAGDGCNWEYFDDDGNGIATTTAACMPKRRR